MKQFIRNHWPELLGILTAILIAVVNVPTGNKETALWQLPIILLWIVIIGYKEQVLLTEEIAGTQHGLIKTQLKIINTLENQKGHLFSVLKSTEDALSEDEPVPTKVLSDLKEFLDEFGRE